MINIEQTTLKVTNISAWPFQVSGGKSPTFHRKGPGSIPGHCKYDF
jgi:hypothetical protein